MNKTYISAIVEDCHASLLGAGVSNDDIDAYQARLYGEEITYSPHEPKPLCDGFVPVEAYLSSKADGKPKEFKMNRLQHQLRLHAVGQALLKNISNAALIAEFNRLDERLNNYDRDTQAKRAQRARGGAATARKRSQKTDQIVKAAMLEIKFDRAKDSFQKLANKAKLPLTTVKRAFKRLTVDASAKKLVR